MTQPVFTLLARNPQTGLWEDVYESYIRSDCADQWIYNFNGYNGYQPKDGKIVKTDGSLGAMNRVMARLCAEERADAA